MLLTILLAIILVVGSFFLWCAIHEYSHLIAYKVLGKVKSYKIRLWPRKIEDRLVWAHINVELEKPLPMEQQWKVNLAPRVPNIVAAVALPLGMLFLSGLGLMTWVIIWASGLVDFFVGSIGKHPSSDLMRASKSLDLEPVNLRLPGFMIIAISLIITLVLII